MSVDRFTEMVAVLAGDAPTPEPALPGRKHVASNTPRSDALLILNEKFDRAFPVTTAAMLPHNTESQP